MKSLRSLILLLLGLIIIVLLVIQFLPKGALSTDQEETIKVFGYPHQFVISYLPSGDDSTNTLVRVEVWYYPEAEVKITFTAGNVFDVADFEKNELENVAATKLRPENYAFETSLEDIRATFSNPEIAEIDFMPEIFSSESIQSYISSEAIFTIESGALTYFQTVGLGNEE